VNGAIEFQFWFVFRFRNKNEVVNREARA